MNIEIRPILAEVFASDYLQGGAGSYVRLHNPGPATVDLTGWGLDWGGVALAFPSGALFPAGASLYVARDADAFRQNLTRLPDYTLTPFPGVPFLGGSGATAEFTPEAGYVRLFTGAGEVVDTFAWGDVQTPAGWAGPAAAVTERGVVYQRAIDESTLTDTSSGQFVLDRGNAAAWWQGTDWMPRRQMRVGQGAFPYPSLNAASALVFTTPDGGLGPICDLIDGAHNTLDINIYLFTQDAIADRVAAALGRGVMVRLFMEGEPVEGLSGDDRATMERLQAAGAQVRVLYQSQAGFKRYHFTHAKYAIADRRFCLIMSDNWTHTSVPDTPKTGNRGWGVILDTSELAAHLTRIFNCDWNPASPDSILLDPSVKIPEPEPLDGLQAIPVPISNPIQPIHMEGPITVTPMIAPEHALLSTRGISGLLRSATRSLDIEQQSVALSWGWGENDSPITTPNLFLEELIAAARRGVQVRLLLSGSYIDPTNPHNNAYTKDYLDGVNAAEHLPLEVRILDYASSHMAIHNKGIIVDERDVLVTSVNWTQNSPLANREVGILLSHPSVAAYFGAVFDRDWGTA